MTASLCGDVRIAVPAPPESRIARWYRQWDDLRPDLLCGAVIHGFETTEILAMADEECRSLWQRASVEGPCVADEPLLRREIARCYSGIAEDEIVTFPRAETALYAVLRTILSPGDHAVVLRPCFAPFRDLCEALGATVTTVPLDPSKWHPDLRAIERALGLRTRVVVANFPHNPTGSLPRRDMLMSLAALCESAGVRLLCDEVFRMTEQEPGDRLPAAVEVSRSAISLGSLRKMFAAPKLGGAWVACRDESFVGRLIATGASLTGHSAPDGVLGVIAFRNRGALLTRGRGIVAENIALVGGLVERWPGLVGWTQPVAGCTGYIALRGVSSAEDFVSALAAEERVLLMPGSLFNDPDPKVRIGLGYRRMAPSLRRVERFLSRRVGATG